MEKISYRIKSKLNSTLSAIIAILSVISALIIILAILYFASQLFLAGLVWQPLVLGFGGTTLLVIFSVSVF